MLPNPTAVHHITDAELDALSAWWWTRSIKAAATFLGIAEQTLKNQLADARRRNGTHKTIELVQLFGGQLRSVQAMQHKRRREAA
jgi:hypothetical protein